MKYTKEQIQFIKDNYPEKGALFCSEKLNLKPKSILRWCSTNKVGLTPAVNYTIFTDIKTPETSYLLGLLWADGNIYKDRISIECVQEDLYYLYQFFLKTGKWCSSFRLRPNRQPQMNISTNNKNLANFLKENDYHAKSQASADKILSKIPDDLKHYWFRGLVDGDGCFYVGHLTHKKNMNKVFSIDSSYDQNWTYVENLFKSLNIKYGIFKRTQNNGADKASAIRISNYEGIVKLGEYIYQGYEEDRMGLDRKYNKWLWLRNYFYTGVLEQEEGVLIK